MAEAAGGISHSRFYVEDFDSAVFDGLLRVYFAKHQESEGLRIYYRLQEALGLRQKRSSQRMGPNLFVMTYPTLESYRKAALIGHQDSYFFVIPHGDDWVMGINVHALDERYDILCQHIPNSFINHQELAANICTI